ncbi:hypothetical protein C2G38_2192423 [Gigaspora rosea]|uniref:Uncharacterized protein n=1 Tax=Gigaspora rosea TaxID=44941 RepID=A0A397V1G1_9GLOM|nr:hypothetical protein C2G38_2192423 [Gigaspora rosea]
MGVPVLRQILYLVDSTWMRVQLATCTLLVSNLSGPSEGSTLDAIPATQLRELPI